MKHYQVRSGAGWLTLFCALAAFTAMADDWNKKTVITFSGPVEIPGVHLKGWGVLPAGTYVFKVMDSMSDRHIVQISDKNETTVYATILAIPNYRLQATDKTVITFRERPAGQPEALRAWFYPGRNSGEEFVYPKTMATELAKSTNVPVLYAITDLPTEFAEPEKLTEESLIAALKRVPIQAVQPSGDEVQLAQVVTPPPADNNAQVAASTPVAEGTPSAAPVTAPATASDPNSQAAPALASDPNSQGATAASPVPGVPMLPGTASLLPLIGLLGVLALGFGLALRFVSKSA